jgi:hypothetical protein
MIPGLASLRTSAIILPINHNSQHDAFNHDHLADAEHDVVAIAEPIHVHRAAVPAFLDQLAQRAADDYPHLLHFVGVVPLTPREYADGTPDDGDNQERAVSPRRRRRRRLQRPGQRQDHDPQQHGNAHDTHDALGRLCVFIASVWEACRPLRNDDLVDPTAALHTSRLRHVMPIALAVAKAVQSLTENGVVHGSVRY